jgi:hypothetical protein
MIVVLILLFSITYFLFFHPIELFRDDLIGILEENGYHVDDKSFFAIAEEYPPWYNVVWVNELVYPDAPWNNTKVSYDVWVNRDTRVVRIEGASD